MLSRHRTVLAAAALAAALTAPAAFAAPVPTAGDGVRHGLAAVPASAPIVFHLRGVERTKDRHGRLPHGRGPQPRPGRRRPARQAD